MRKWWILLAALLIMACCCAGAEDGSEEPEDIVCGDFIYAVLPDGSAEIVAYSGCEADLVIPAELDGRPVTSLLEHALLWSTAPASVTIPDSVLRFEPTAFESHASLETFIVSPSHPTLMSIDGVLFDREGCLIRYPTGRTDEAYEIPAGTRGIGEFAFADCGTLRRSPYPIR
ncbi:MAG: hypothetical protein IKK75_12040 [Clostridia bacterium]|nr:hypothetical protein [Clostridia bacterium]